MSGETIWVMDSECCDTCGCLLDYFESVLCTDCLHDAWYNEDQARYASFEEDDQYTDYNERAYLMGEYDEGKEKAGTSDL